MRRYRIKIHDYEKIEEPEDMDEDPINPSHYKSYTMEVIDVIESFGLNFCLGNVIKYTLRAGKKGNRTEDLQKALWYLQREIDNDTKLNSL